MTAHRELFWNIGPLSLLIYLLAAITTGVMLFGLYSHYKRWRIGQPIARLDRFWQRLTYVIGYLIAQRRVLRNEAYAGWMHFLIFWGFGLDLATTAVDVIAHYGHELVGIPELSGAPYLAVSLVGDIGGLAALIGVAMALGRRYIARPQRLDSLFDDGLTLALLALILLTGFALEGFRMAATEIGPHPDWALWSPIGLIFAQASLGLGSGGLLTAHAITWWTHGLLVMGTLSYLAWSKLGHIAFSTVGVYTRSYGPVGELRSIPNFEEAETFGIAKIEDFTWKDLLDLDACTRCGRCQDNCPAFFSGKALSPKKVIQDLKAHFYETYPSALSGQPIEARKDMIDEIITEEVVWDCTTCRACQHACPVYVEHIDKVIGMRRNLVLEQARMPRTAQDALTCLTDRGHPWRGTPASRTDWTEGLGIRTLAGLDEGESFDLLYWVGCTAALEGRNMKVAISFARVMQAAGVSFAILGTEEACCGDPARRMGDEYTYQLSCQRNIGLFEQYGVKRIVTACPHCLNTLKNEYPGFGGSFEVIHHSELIADLLRQGRLRPGSLDPMTVAYHDGCYLGRYNEIFEAPRAVVGAVGGVSRIELGRSKETSFCCGAGGGHCWMEEPIEQRINVRRIDEIVAAGADVVATACPFCLFMLEDGTKARGVDESLRVLDISELLADALPPPTAGS